MMLVELCLTNDLCCFVCLLVFLGNQCFGAGYKYVTMQFFQKYQVKHDIHPGELRGLHVAILTIFSNLPIFENVIFIYM